MAAAVWSAATPHIAAVGQAQTLGLASYGTSGTQKFVPLAWPGNKRAVLTKLSSDGGDYTQTTGDTLTPADFGLTEIHGILPFGSDTANARPGAAGMPVVRSVGTAPKLGLRIAAAADHAAAATTNYAFHAIIVGI